MQTEFERFGGELLIHMAGEIDHHSAEKLKERIDGAAKDPSTAKVYMDFSRVTFMDSSGVGVILGRYRKLSERGIPLAIYGPSPRMQRILDLASLQRIIPICGDLESARRALKGGK